jgi:2,4-dienoyl-CoA reductase-like NADH-dependent reductase (Old Yellow Enzyme family)
VPESQNNRLGVPDDSAADTVRGGTETTVENSIADAVAFGRHFVAHPDLPLRIKEGLALTRYDRDTFWTFGSVGYNDYPFVNELASF